MVGLCELAASVGGAPPEEFAGGADGAGRGGVGAAGGGGRGGRPARLGGWAVREVAEPGCAGGRAGAQFGCGDILVCWRLPGWRQVRRDGVPEQLVEVEAR